MSPVAVLLGSVTKTLNFTQRDISSNCVVKLNHPMLMTSSGSLDFYTKSSLSSYSFSLWSCSHFLANRGLLECALLDLRDINTENMGDLTMCFHSARLAVLYWGASSRLLHPHLWTFVHVQPSFLVSPQGGWCAIGIKCVRAGVLLNIQAYSGIPLQ